jgi:hypothetical protein
VIMINVERRPYELPKGVLPGFRLNVASTNLAELLNALDVPDESDTCGITMFGRAVDALSARQGLADMVVRADLGSALARAEVRRFQTLHGALGDLATELARNGMDN